MKPATTFTGRAGFATAYDPVSKKIVLFGGVDGTGELNDTWTFDGTTWEQVQNSGGPGPRGDAAMAYDAKTHKLVMFGGYHGFAFLNETWLWDGATSTWTQAQPATIPAAATNPILFSDPVNGHADMFGGYQDQFFSRSMYPWSGTDWILLNPPTTPYPRSGAVVAYDPIRKMSCCSAASPITGLCRTPGLGTVSIGPSRLPRTSLQRPISAMALSIPL